jgi:hypothetical protein
MNPLQSYLEEQKTYYTKKLAEDNAPTMREIRAELTRLLPLDKALPIRRIMSKLYEFQTHVINLYCRLLIANIEGEIIKIVKGSYEHEKFDSSALLEHWVLPGGDPARPRNRAERLAAGAAGTLAAAAASQVRAISEEYDEYAQKMDAGEYTPDPRD